MARGPKPTPTKVLEMRGSWRAKHRRKKGEFSPEPGLPDCPEWLAGEARELFQALASDLNKHGIITKLDGLTLAHMCEAHCVFLKERARVLREGTVLRSKSGYSYQNPRCAVMNKAQAAFMAGVQRFGLSPADRVRLPSPAEPKEPKGEARVEKLFRIG